jgi:hypothetical protein
VKLFLSRQRLAKDLARTFLGMGDVGPATKCRQSFLLN